MKRYSQDMRAFWDKIGLGLSGLCLVHCLVLPVACQLSQVLQRLLVVCLLCPALLQRFLVNNPRP